MDFLINNKNIHIEYFNLNSIDDKSAFKKQYRKLSKQYHPDSVGGNTDIFQHIQSEYDVISDNLLFLSSERNKFVSPIKQQTSFEERYQEYYKKYQEYQKRQAEKVKKEQEIQNFQKRREKERAEQTRKWQEKNKQAWNDNRTKTKAKEDIITNNNINQELKPKPEPSKPETTKPKQEISKSKLEISKSEPKPKPDIESKPLTDLPKNGGMVSKKIKSDGNIKKLVDKIPTKAKIAALAVTGTAILATAYNNNKTDKKDKENEQNEKIKSKIRNEADVESWRLVDSDNAKYISQFSRGHSTYNLRG